MNTQNILLISCNVPQDVHQTRRNVAVRPKKEGNFYAKNDSEPAQTVVSRAVRNKRAQSHCLRVRNTRMRPRSGLKPMHAKAGPSGTRLQRDGEDEMAALRMISTSAPFHMPRMNFRSTCGQGGRGQGARCALLVSHPLARGTTHGTLLGERLHARARRSPHSSIEMGKQFALSRAR